MSKLKNYCLNITDGEHGSVKDDSLGNYYLLSNKNIINGEIIFDSSDRKISKDTFNKLINRSKLDVNDVVVSTVGTLGKTAVIKGDINYVFQRSVGIIKTDSKKLNPFYLKYQLDTPLFQKKLNLLSNGGLQKGLYIGDLENLEIECPSIRKQNSIVKILKTIDDKISINNKINVNLESLAKTLYDYWFLQFEFPNEEGKSYKSSGGKMVYNEQLKKDIPEGWEVKTLSQTTNMYQPSTFDAKLLEKDGLYRVYGAGGYMGQYHEYNHEEQEVFISCRGSCGNVYKSMPKSLITGNAMIVHPHDSTLFNYLYLTLLRYGVKKCITGSVQPQITRDSLNDWLFIVPSKSILEKFNQLVIPMSSKINNINNENQELTKLRDFLLPLLMNGQVTIQDAEEQVKNVINNIWDAGKLLRFTQWKQMQGYAARGEVDEEILMKIFDAMDKDVKK